ncbi:hypothetical protein CPC08DRAFT_630209 [Agrocybe pediades]|nr:hypothetical protein CPC08DRAFT_630209 [Agrocybe pediades]
MSRDIVRRYVGTTPMVSEERRKVVGERDEVYTNQILRNYNELLYLETSHAMNAGDIGRVEDTFLHWVYIFRATGKHKYASQTLRMINNLYTKVIYGGEGSTRTLKHILDESILIEFFRECHVTIENGFHLVNRTISHHPTNMVKTLHRMEHHFDDGNPHVYTPGRKAEHNVPDMIAVGMHDIQTKKIIITEELRTDEQSDECLDPDDLAVEN